MNSCVEAYRSLQKQIRDIAIGCQRSPDEITLVAISKMQSMDAIQQLYEAGCRNFGESRIQEALPKIAVAPNDIQWHFVGTLQKNKVNQAIGKFVLIHSVDSLELASKISLSSMQAGVITRVLIQTNTSEEPTKHGLSPEEWKRVFSQLRSLGGISVEGVMAMAPLTKQTDIIRACFRKARELRDELQLKHVSMGMSHDYPIAIEEGATLLRIGTKLWQL